MNIGLLSRMKAASVRDKVVCVASMRDKVVCGVYLAFYAPQKFIKEYI